jgi:hypothetical protein
VKLAVKMMSVWLREAGDEERQLVRSRVERALEALGNEELVKIFDERTAKGPVSVESEIDLLLVQRIAKIALDTKDALLAKRLLVAGGPLLGNRGDEVAHLAAGAAAIRVDARTIGLLLSFRTSETRRRSAEVASGVVWGLDLPGSGARLAVRDDVGDEKLLDEALTELGRDGAAVIIAGLDDVDARASAAFAEKQHVPVILISRPPDVIAAAPGATPGAPAAESFVFPLGSSPQAWTPSGDSRLDRWIDAHGALPSYWAAAGRDAAVLARRSVKDLPEATTEDAAEVEMRRKTVRAALAQTTSGLWTIDHPEPSASSDSK